MEMPEDDIPPEEIWHSEPRMKEWFDAVRQRREDKMRGRETVPEADEDMTSNAAVDEVLGARA